MSNKSNKALVLVSGGLDSTVVLSICKRLDLKIYAISFDYGQRHRIELNFARWQSNYFQCKSHKIFKIDLFGGSALTDNIEVPTNKKVELIPNDIPETYVPSRNIIFLSFASGYAEFLGIDKIFIGVNAIDYSGYPDCRQEFIKGFEKLINFSTKKGLEGNKFKIKTPLINLTKKEIILIGKKNGVNFSKTSSCYNPRKGKSCGICDSCLLRKKGFDEARLDDPLFKVR
tara:strand:+ start:223 stop:909 length:687 start_codon:yes stop_codon:yes gene_type:complete